MNDPRDVGLPPLEGAPAFSSDPQALGEVRRRYTRRRHRRMTAAGGSLAAVIVAIAVALDPGGATSSLEQDQPAHQGGVGESSPSPTRSADAPTQLRQSGGAGPSSAPGHGQVTAAPRGVPTAAALPPRADASVPADSTRVRRGLTAMGNQPNCRQPLNGWQALGWCFESDNPDTLTAGHSAALSISLCRDSTLGEQVRFPSSRQAVWSISRGGTQLWSSNEQPSSFPAGQAENLAPGACLHWRVDWRVTAHGRPLPPGDYDLTWSTGADIRDANNHEYHDAQVVHVAPASS